MKRAWKISVSAHTELLCLQRSSRNPRILRPHLLGHARSPAHGFSREICDMAAPSSAGVREIMEMFIDKFARVENRAVLGEGVLARVLELRDELVQLNGRDEIVRVLDEKADPLLLSVDALAFLELLKQLDSWPHRALEVLFWKRKLQERGIPMTSEEYVKGIRVAGRMKDVDLAFELFMEATSKRLKTTSTYNALMGAYMYNGLAGKCQKLFLELKGDADCSPSIVTYNILISVFGRLMLIDHMEATFREVELLNLAPNVGTYNNLIAGYLTAWMWDNMERTFQTMKASPVKPSTSTYLLMLRGYAHSGNLEKMEETYELVKDHVNENDVALIRAMICAYCRSSTMDRVRKIEMLLGLIPENGYRPWLNVLLIKVYAQEDWLDKMESSINEAFEQRTSVNAAGVMRAIVGSYFRCNALDKLASFVKRAECAGWRICRSLFHCKMVMYGSQQRLVEMESVLDEMESFNFNRTKKTFVIMYYAYLSSGKKNKAEQIKGLMCKHGYGVPHDAVSS
ncbi:pentatricopeptide repeat-containing protein At2g30780-like [Rhodamnia argentea]|uniref:Pentatricopeptide repeat-containing protein At2g30780-like n=1 Tax=Rhodamnia argentea TaxID=178133 RepID=A0A8B8QZ32_9MYRT|nr:pentatricopeptide repeat-containing protein At2g30780-like [Rhodamnia argentea]XP_030552461.1 pentatricopeptide repeat-containing protein At2g30780-like [Rhodamnia argentea]XP_048139831.1 pentatricopeptide repeat-containing protein At2g30780-like [Rhodamnia argentea]